jgi:predicted transcriptional regulator
MKQLLIEVDDELAAELEKVAPGRSRKRSEFVRHALRKALWAIEEQATAKAYEKRPDSEADACFDPSVWESSPKTGSVRRKK